MEALEESVSQERKRTAEPACNDLFKGGKIVMATIGGDSFLL